MASINTKRSWLTLMGRRAHMAVATPRTRDRLVRQPLLLHLNSGRKKKDVSPQDYAIAAYHLGYPAPYLAVRTINHFLAEKKVSDDKRLVLQQVVIGLKRDGRMALISKGLWAFSFFLLGRIAWLSLFPVSPTEPTKYEQKQTFPPPITISLGAESFTLYGQEGWNPEFRAKCSDLFPAENVMGEKDLRQCVKRVTGASLEESTFLSYLRSMEGATIRLDEKAFDRSLAIVEALAQVPDLQLTTTSTEDIDNSVGEPIRDEVNEAVDYTPYYRQAYGAESVEQPDLLKKIDVFFVSDPITPKSALPAEMTLVQHRVIVGPEKSPEEVFFIPLDINSVLYLLRSNRIVNALSLAKNFALETERAADILFAAHGRELSREQLRSLLNTKLMVQMVSMRQEDPWQDISACEWSECTRLEAYQAAFEGVDYGVKKLGMLIRPPWSLASDLYVDKERQGFGPYQAIFGLYKEAATDPVVRERFAAELSEADFEDDEAMLRTILDKPTMSMAFIYDYVMTQLEKTTFANNLVRTLPTLPPFVENERVARQIAFMGAATITVGYPERRIMARELTVLGSPMLPLMQFVDELLYPDSFLFPGMGKRALTATVNTGEQFMTYTIFDPRHLRK